jgi:uncharacterized protein
MTAVLPYTGKDFYVPSFKVLIKSQALDQIVHDVISVSYSDSLTSIDSFDMTVNNWDPGAPGARGRFKYSDANTFDPYQDVELWLGYLSGGRDERRRMLVGEITTMSPSFPSGGASTLTIRALNLLHRFRTGQQTKVWVREKDSKIAQDIVDLIATDVRRRIPQLTLQMDQDEKAVNLRQENPVDYVVMHNDYPIHFLFTRARRIGYELSVEERQEGSNRVVTFHFRRPNQVTTPTYRLEWGKSLISFAPTLQTANQVSEVVVKWWDPQTKAARESRATRADLRGEGVVNPVDLNVTESPLAQKLEVVSDRIIHNVTEGEQLALRTLRQLAQGLVEGRGKTIGLPNLVAGCKVEIAGLGSRFEGTYVVTSTTHALGDSGYTTDFTARMEQRLQGAAA